MVCAACLLWAGACASPPLTYDDLKNDFPPEEMSGADAFDFLRERGLALGWNLGNTLDAYVGGIADEEAWGNPPASRALLDGIKAAGYDIVRIPVTWMGHIGPAPEYRLSPERLRRVEEVLLMARDAGLAAVINLHHDGSTPSATREDGWLSIKKSLANKADYAEISAKFQRVWQQLAVYFKNYGDWLIFEPFNELQDGGWGGSPEFVSDPRSQLAVINEWNQLFTDTVRGTGGNNALRFLLVPGYGSNFRLTLSNNFKIPRDSASGRQIVTFHYYEPYEFGILGDQAGGRHNWGTDADRQKIIHDFSPFKEWYIDERIPVLLGECGAVLQEYPRDPEKHEQARRARREYIACIFGAARDYGLIPLCWDNGVAYGRDGEEKFGLFDRTTGQPNSDESAFLIATMIRTLKPDAAVQP